MSTTISQQSDIRVLIKGAGGHGIVVADILWLMHRYFMGVIPIGFMDDNAELHGQSFLDLPVFGAGIKDVNYPYDAIIIAIGSNHIRREKFCQYKEEGSGFAIVQHSSAIIANHVLINEGAVICAGAIANSYVRIGANAILNTGCLIDHHCRIGDHVHIAPGVRLGGDVQVGEGALVGIGSTVLPGCKVGAWCTIGGGAVVTCDVPDGEVWSGTPAKPHNL